MDHLSRLLRTTLFLLTGLAVLLGHVAPTIADTIEVLSHQKISDTQGGFTGVLDDSDLFGAVSALGDLDGDGVTDLAVGAFGDGDGGTNRGAVWILFLNADGTVKTHQKISDTQGGFVGILDNNDVLGRDLCALDDLDGDGVTDLAVGAVGDDDGGGERGAVWILFLNADGTVKAHQKISDTQGGFTGVLDASDRFGSSLADLGDLDADGVTDVAVGAISDDDGGDGHGAVWILFLNADGTVKTHQKISDTQGGFTGILDVQDQFGTSAAALGDLDGDDVTDVAVGARVDGDGGIAHGAVWILFLNTNGTVKAHQKISDTQGGFSGVLDQNDFFGHSAAALGDLDGDGVTDLVVGATGDDDGGADRGAVWILFLNADGTVKTHQKISDTQGEFTGELDDDNFGWSVAGLGDLDGNGFADLAVGAVSDDDGGADRGAVWMLFLGAKSNCIHPSSHCRLPDQASHGSGNVYASASDAAGNQFTAANLTPSANGSVQSLCWWGLYFDCTTTTECANPPADDFTITYFASDGVGGHPSVVIAGPYNVGGANRRATGLTVNGFIEHEYSASHPPVGVVVGECYWVQIYNNLDGDCVWMWSTAAPGDGKGAQANVQAPYSAADLTDYDLAFCIDACPLGSLAGACSIPVAASDAVAVTGGECSVLADVIEVPTASTGALIVMAAAVACIGSFMMRSSSSSRR